MSMASRAGMSMTKRVHGATRYILDIAAAFNRFYHNCPILNAEDPAVKAMRIRLTEATNIVLGSAFSLICLKKTEKV